MYLLFTLGVAMIVSQIAVFSTTIYLHRTMAHYALTLHPSMAWVFRCFLWITTGQKTREWVAVHRKHHTFVDREGDPHSPILEGFWSIQLGNVVHYARALRDKNILIKYTPDIKEDIWDKWFFNYGLLGVSLGTVILCALLGLGWGLLAAGVHVFTYVFLLSSSVNGLCHYKGYRNFFNTATNLRFVALITAGEGLHNNHHGFAHSPKFSCRASEFDPAWPIIKLLKMLGLARNVKKTSSEQGLRFRRIRRSMLPRP